jgi:hypothetical protein
MIIYNFRHRGTFEYDKFVLNALQLRNQVNYLLKQQGVSSGLNAYAQDIDTRFTAAQQHSHDIYMTMVDYWEV